MTKEGNVWLKAVYDEKDKPPITEVTFKYNLEVGEDGYLVSQIFTKYISRFSEDRYFSKREIHFHPS